MSFSKKDKRDAIAALEKAIKEYDVYDGEGDYEYAIECILEALALLRKGKAQ